MTFDFVFIMNLMLLTSSCLDKDIKFEITIQLDFHQVLLSFVKYMSTV